MFTNVEVYFPVKHAEEAEDGELSWNFFVGFRMEDVRHGELGEVVEVDTATVNTLFVVEQEDGEELLVPAQEEFIVEINQEKKAHHSRASRRIVEFGRFGGRLIINKDAKKTE